MRHRTLVAGISLALTALVATVHAADLPAGYGVVCPSGSTYTTTISADGDTDDYAFPAYPGTTVTVVVKPGKVVAPDVPLVPAVEFIRPDGSVPDDDSSFSTSEKGKESTGITVTAKMTLDAPGWWKVRVQGKDLAAPADPAPKYSFGPYSVSIVYKSPASQPTLPVVSKSFASKGAVISTKSDTDDYVFQAYPGQTIAATVTKPKTSALIPGLSLIRPDGTQVTGGAPFDGKKAGVSTTAGANDQGTWRVRVFGVDPSNPPDPKAPKNTTGAYTLAVKLGKPSVTPSIKPDGNHQYRFVVPASGGATMSYALTFKGDAPVFNSCVDPEGKPVPGFNGSVKLTGYRVPDQLPIGNYTLTFDAPANPPTNVSFSSKVTAPTLGKPRKLTLAAVEPIILIGGINPTSGSSKNNTPITIFTNGNLVDPSVNDPSQVAVFLDHTQLSVDSVNGSTVKATVKSGMSVGVHDIVVQTSSGQVAVAEGAFEIVPPPVAISIDPVVGSVAGGYPMTITGTGFSKLTDPQIVIDSLTTSAIVPVHIDSVTDTEIKFIAPAYGAPGKKTFGVIDNVNSNGDLLPLESFEYVSSPAINRLVPNLTTILGGDLISVTGANFQPTDHVYIEKTPGSGGIDTQGNLFGYDELFNTYVNSTMHQFTAPVRSKGVYNVFVFDQFFQPKPPRVRGLTYFQFSDLSTTVSGIFPSGTDVWDGNSVAVADFDKDGVDDLFISRVGGATADGSSDTRVLHNDPQSPGHFTDVTASVMPDVTSTEDWRADRIWVTDVNKDGYPDIVIVTNDQTVLSQNVSHVRILINEQRTATNPNDRVFRDHTSSLMPAVRMSNPLYSGSSGVADNWRGLDMWVGDVDKGPVGPPEILITHKDPKAELDVSCSPYCSSPFASGYTYGFYWGGSRAFFWDKTANGGLGKYKFERNFFPRKSGLRVPITAPGGVSVPICNASYGQPCVNRFTPFFGKRITAADLNGDTKPDVAVLSDAQVQRIFPPSSALTTISSLQVGINKFNSSDGAEITDVTAQLTALGGDFSGDALAIASLGYPDGNAYGTIAVAKATAQGGSMAMRLLKYKPGGVPATPYDFEDITSNCMPATSGGESWQASQIIFKDVDNDGDQDMILVCPTPPGGTGPAFRVLRNDIVNFKAGILTTNLMSLLQSPYLPLGGNEHYEGDAMATGDFNADGVTDFVIVRASTTAQAPETRIVIIDKKN
jgi:hypothetical protein